jgi:hypothetical protein
VIEHTARLPLGFVVTFHWDGTVIHVEWLPDVPGSIRSPRHRRRFLAAYDAARDDFLTEVATLIDGTIGCITLDGRLTICRPMAKH